METANSKKATVLWVDDEIDLLKVQIQLLERVDAASDETLLQKVYSDIQMTIVNRLPIMGLLFRTGTVLSSRSIGGLGGVRAYDAFNGFEFLKKVN